MIAASTAPRALPVTVSPVPHETPATLLRRLAGANHLRLDILRRAAARVRAPGVDLDKLAALAGLPGERLGEILCTREGSWLIEPRQACHRCLARRGVHHPMRISAPTSHTVCLKHRLWLPAEAGAWAEYQYDLRTVPDVLTAHRRHRQLVERWATARPVASAYLDARQIVQRWAQRLEWTTDRDRRLARIIPPGWTVASGHPLAAMVDYPTVVRLTALLAHPHWRALALSTHPADVERFHHELRQRLRINYIAYTSHDPLVHWRELHRDLDEATRVAITLPDRSARLPDQDVGGST